MFNWIRRRRLSPDARKRLLLVAARSEEALIETHVENMLDLLDSLGDELDVDRAIGIYAELLSLDETRAATVSNRLLSRLERPATRERPRRPRTRNRFREQPNR